MMYYLQNKEGKVYRNKMLLFTCTLIFNFLEHIVSKLKTREAHRDINTMRIWQKVHREIDTGKRFHDPMQKGSIIPNLSFNPTVKEPNSW